MALKSAVCILVLIALLWPNSLDGPFKTGFSMGTLGTVTGKNSMLLCRDTLKRTAQGCLWGLSATYTSFYDAMDNLRDESVCQVGIDAIVKRKYFLLYLSANQFNALSLYYEQYCTGGLEYELLNLISIGIAVTGLRTGITCYNDNHVSAMFNGNVQARINRVVIGAQMYNVPLKSTKTFGVMPVVMYGFGIQTLENVFGAQAFRLEIRPALEKKVRWLLGNELAIGKRITIQSAIANNPMQFSFGLQVEFKPLLSSIALVNNEKLGWSKGVSFGWFGGGG
ncbi:MAG: hypothetical protein GX639_03660 [Fibrobacter sp.]|nr:hypothetical protein [Fibrobacter sp.]